MVFSIRNVLTVSARTGTRSLSQPGLPGSASLSKALHSAHHGAFAGLPHLPAECSASNETAGGPIGAVS